MHQMPSYEVLPGVGVGPVRLGMPRDEVHRVFGEPPEIFKKTDSMEHDIDGYHGAGFQIIYGGSRPTVEYIELSSHSGFIAVYKGHDVFNTKADVLVSIVLQDAAVDENDPEYGFAFIFPDLELSLWRPVVPESEDDPEGQYFATIGVGIEGYYSDQW